jgi:hypothetical protein
MPPEAIDIMKKIITAAEKSSEKSSEKSPAEKPAEAGKLTRPAIKKWLGSSLRVELFGLDISGLEMFCEHICLGKKRPGPSKTFKKSKRPGQTINPSDTDNLNISAATLMFLRAAIVGLRIFEMPCRWTFEM